MGTTPRSTGRAPWEESTDGPLPNFVIVGAMRSGTTSLTHHLRQHPQVFMSSTKEVHFFDSHFEEGLDWYRAHFAGSDGEPAVGEATPNYLHDRRAIPRMAEVIPEARLLAILRNPVDRAYSHYWHNRARGKEPLEFEEALAVEQDRLVGDELDRAWYSYLDRGRYVGQLRRICEFFPRRSLHVLLSEDLRHRPRRTFGEVCGFLGVDQGFVPVGIEEPHNSFVGFRSPTVRRLAKQLPDSARRIVGRLNSVRRASYPPMEPATRMRLVESYREENRELADFLGRDLSAWQA